MEQQPLTADLKLSLTFLTHFICAQGSQKACIFIYIDYSIYTTPTRQKSNMGDKGVLKLLCYRFFSSNFIFVSRDYKVIKVSL